MMTTPLKEIIRDLEQLELAADQLDKKTPAGARLALILTDNTVEGIAIRIAKHKFALDAYVGRAVGFKYPPSVREKISEDFGEKMKFLASQNVQFLSKKAASAFKVLHSFRNDSYHHWRYHEDVIEPIARKYFRLACDVYARSYGDILIDMGRTEPFMERYGFTEPLAYHEGAKAILAGFPTGKECSHQELAKALSDNLSRRVKDTIDQIDSLAEEPYQLAPEETFRRIQFRPENSERSWQNANDNSKPTGRNARTQRCENGTNRPAV
jgi:hypothetical protein